MRASSVRAEARVLKPLRQPDDQPRFDDTTKSPVRERPAVLALGGHCQDQAKCPAHPSNQLIAQLNEDWRVVDDPLQWILQRRKGNPRKKSSGWKSRSFCTTREALLRCICEYCGDVDDDVLARLHDLPEFHLHRDEAR
jgi:hypothetical protein